MKGSTLTIVKEGVWRQNVVTVRLLALCPMLAVSVSVRAALTLGTLTMMVMIIAGVTVSGLRTLTPKAIRLPTFLVIVALIVAVMDTLLAAYDLALHRQLGIFLPLIITNCAVLARLELFAHHKSPLVSALDGLASGGGMLLALTLLASVRELLATGKISLFFDTPLFTGGLPITLLPAGGFILFGLLLAGYRQLNLG